MKRFVLFTLVFIICLVLPAYSVTYTPNLGLNLIEDHYNNTSPSWGQLLRDNFSMIDDALHKAGNINIRVPDGEVFLGQDYCDLVIALCEITNDNPNLYSYSAGMVSMRRSNGLDSITRVDVSLQKRYNTTHSTGFVITSEGSNYYKVTRVLFKYNNKWYAGIKVHQAASCIHNATFNGDTNFDIFGLAYYNHNTGDILNQEVYDSIQEETHDLDSKLYTINSPVELKSSYYSKLSLTDMSHTRLDSNYRSFIEGYDKDHNPTYIIGHLWDTSNALCISNECPGGGGIKFYTKDDSSGYHSSLINDLGNWTLGSSSDLAGDRCKLYVNGPLEINGATIECLLDNKNVSFRYGCAFNFNNRKDAWDSEYAEIKLSGSWYSDSTEVNTYGGYMIGNSRYYKDIESDPSTATYLYSRRFGNSSMKHLFLNPFGNFTLGGTISSNVTDLAGTDYRLYVDGVSNFNGDVWVTGSGSTYGSNVMFKNDDFTGMSGYDTSNNLKWWVGEGNSTDPNGARDLAMSCIDGCLRFQAMGVTAGYVNSYQNWTIGGGNNNDLAGSTYKLYVNGYNNLTSYVTYSGDSSYSNGNMIIETEFVGTSSSFILTGHIDIAYLFGHSSVSSLDFICHKDYYSGTIDRLYVTKTGYYNTTLSAYLDESGRLCFLLTDVPNWSPVSVYIRRRFANQPNNIVTRVYPGEVPSSVTDVHLQDTMYQVWASDTDGSGSGLDADLLDGMNSSDFLYKIMYNPGDGVYIKTDIPDSSSTMFLAKIYINHYTTTKSEHIIVQGYTYAGNGEWYGLRALGLTRAEGHVNVFIKDGYVCFWLPTLAVAETVYCNVSTQYSARNRVTEMADTDMPTEGVSKVVQVDIEGVNADLLDGYNSSVSPDPHTVVVRGTSGDIEANGKLKLYSDYDDASSMNTQYVMGYSSDGVPYWYVGDGTSIAGSNPLILHAYKGSMIFRANNITAGYINTSQNWTLGNSDLAGTSYKLYVDGNSYFSREIKQKSNWGVESYLSQYQITSPLRDYSYWVVGLVDLTNDSVAAERFAFGDLYITRYSGSNYQIHINFTMSKPYNDDRLVVAFQNLSDYGMSLNLTPCTFTYNGRKYGGFSFALTNSPNRFRFIGESNNKMFAIPYKDTRDDSVVNQEIYDSIVLNDNYRCTQYYKRNYYGNITLGGGINEDLAGTTYKLYVDGQFKMNGHMLDMKSPTGLNPTDSYCYLVARDANNNSSWLIGNTGEANGELNLWNYCLGQNIQFTTSKNSGLDTHNMVISPNGGVTIGTTYDLAGSTYKLYVDGDQYINGTLRINSDSIKLFNDIYGYLVCYNTSGTQKWYIGDGSSGEDNLSLVNRLGIINFYTYNTGAGYINTSQNWTIGQASDLAGTDYKLYVDGDVNISGNLLVNGSAPGGFNLDLIASGIMDKTENLHGMWIWEGSGTDVLDSSYAFHNGTMYGGPTMDNLQTQGSGKFMTFDGSDDYVRFSDASDLTFADVNGDLPFSITILFKYASTGAYPLLTKRNIGDNISGYEWVFYTNYVTLFNGSYDNYIQASNPSYPPANQWNILTYTYDGSGVKEGFKIYLNGRLVSNNFASSGSYNGTVDTNSSVIIGANQYDSGASNFFNGDIGCVIVEGREMNPVEIFELYKYIKGIYNLD